jgi:glyoxylase-like metal-dependent hydrolase (beta-lactamase superfamily II)
MSAKYVPLVLGLFTCTQAMAHDSTGPQTIEDFSVDRVTSRVYVIHGPRSMPNKTNRGFMNNPGFIVADSGVIVVDPGGSAQVGSELVKKIRSVTDKPVIAIFNTHIHGDHWLGNDGVRRAYPKAAIYAHQRMVERLNQGEDEEWVKLFSQMTEGASDGTRAVGPNISVQHGETLTLGGVKLRIHHPGKAHTDNDILIEVVDDKAVFLGDIVTYRTVPSMVRPQDAYFKGILDALRMASRIPSDTFVPGHGPTGDRRITQETLNFLEKLYGAVTKYYKQGMSDFEMKQPIIKELADYRDWRQFEQLGGAISRIYLEVEAESF